MFEASMIVDQGSVVGPVRRRTFGSFVEHLGRCVYGGIYEPEHPTANEDGFRTDVLDLVKELGVTTVRYPGGNFVSSYRWEDGVGPKEQRPRRLDLAWHSIEPNWVGLDEFMKWAALADVEPMMAVNLGTRGILPAVDVLEYSNIPSGTELSDYRRRNGSEEPHNIRMWCLGNEMDGPWQTGHMSAEDYGKKAAQTARAMRQVDAGLELVACGSSNMEMPTFGSWEHTVLTHCYDVVDYISAHAYYFERDGDTASFLASAVNMDRFVAAVAATCDAVKTAGRHTNDVQISFDEWNVWHQDAPTSQPAGEWSIAPRLLEDNYTVAEAVVVGNLLISLLRNTDRVASASQAQLVNVIAPIMTEPGGKVWKQTTFHPFALTAQFAKGSVLDCQIDSPRHVTSRYGEVDLVDAVATVDAEAGDCAVFAVNRSETEDATVNITIKSPADLRVLEALSYYSDDPSWKASAEDDTAVLPQPNLTAKVEDLEGATTVSVTLPPVSWSVVRLGSK